MFPELGPFLFQILLYIMYMGTLLVSASQYQISSTTLTKHQPRSYDLFGTDRADNVWALGWLTPMWMFVVLLRSGAGAGKAKDEGEERRRKCWIQICLTKARLVLTCHVLSTPLYFTPLFTDLDRKIIYKTIFHRWSCWFSVEWKLIVSLI